MYTVLRTLSAYSYSTVVSTVDSGEADYLSLSIGISSERNVQLQYYGIY